MEGAAVAFVLVRANPSVDQPPPLLISRYESRIFFFIPPSLQPDRRKFNDRRRQDNEQELHGSCGQVGRDLRPTRPILIITCDSSQDKEKKIFFFFPQSPLSNVRSFFAEKSELDFLSRIMEDFGSCASFYFRFKRSRPTRDRRPLRE